MKLSQSSLKLSGLFALFLAVFHANIGFAQEIVIPESEGSEKAELLHWGAFDLHPRLSGAAIYDDNITISRTNELSDVIWAVSPGISIMAGDPFVIDSKVISIDYAPNFSFFTDHTEYNSVDHSARLNGYLPFSKLVLGLGQTFDSLSTPLPNAGGRFGRKVYNTSLTSRYDISPKTSVEANLRQSISDYEGRLIGSKEWANDDWFNYLVAPKLNLGVGATFGYVEVDRSASQLYQRALLRGIYTITYKLDATLSAGLERREYDGRSEVNIRPIFNLGAIYRPREGTTIKLNAYRRDQSALTDVGLNYVTTGMAIGMRQRVSKSIFVNLSGTYDNSEYHSAGVSLSNNRTEDYFSVTLGADAVFTEHWTGGIYLTHRESTSSQSNGVFFDNNQVSLQTTYRF